MYSSLVDRAKLGLVTMHYGLHVEEKECFFSLKALQLLCLAGLPKHCMAILTEHNLFYHMVDLDEKVLH